MCTTLSPSRHRELTAPAGLTVYEFELDIARDGASPRARPHDDVAAVSAVAGDVGSARPDVHGERRPTGRHPGVGGYWGPRSAGISEARFT